jgi:uncharacterized 2Fe-2S/4Fe-4S cluster protein (DUF4445 family)
VSGIDLHVNDRRGPVAPGTSLFDAARGLGVFVPTSCITQGKCKECMVEVAEGMEHLTPRTAAESHLSGSLRLSCQARATPGPAGRLVRCHTMRRGEMRIERRALDLPVRLADVPRDPCVTRDGDRVLLDGRPVAHGGGPLHGLAADLGTTTVVLRLFDLETGEVVADTSFENPQRFGGSDVMSRIHFDTHNKGKLLQRTLAGYLTHAIEEFGVDPHTIYEMVVAGNSTMRDLFFRLDVYSIGQSPYQSITELETRDGRRAETSVTATPRRLQLPIHPKGRVYGLPVISGHVGADAAACMLAVDIGREERLVAVMDIGTNTELIVGNRHRILAASCPAGPAFEGGKILCGMPGLPGAIEEVRIGDDGAIRTATIGGGPAEGICGSGLVDALGELLRTGRMNALGRLEDGSAEIVLDARGERPIVLREADINELAQAKGANVAGLYIIMDRYGRRFEDLDLFYLAGGFGRHLDVASARRIGLVPDLPDAKIRQVGNAAIEGASIALLSRTRRAELEGLVRDVTHVRLETHPDFFHYFVEGCQFQPVESPAPPAPDAGGLAAPEAAGR